MSFVNKAVSTRTQLPILSNVLLETEEGKLKIAATNLETSITFWIGATVEEKGAFTVPARLLTELISSFSAEKINLTVEKSTLVIETTESRATLSGMDPAEFPPLPMPEGERSQLDRKILEDALPFVLTAVSSDEGRPLLTGVRLSEWNGKTALIATDGYRLSIKQIEGADLNKGVVIPAKAFMEVIRATAEEKTETADIFFSKDKNQVIFSLPHVQIATRLIEGEYPPFGKIIPKEHSTRIILSKEDFLRAIKLAAVYAKEASNIIKLHITQGSLVVSANTPQVGENTTHLEVNTEGDDAEIAFNVRFLIDILNVHPSESIVFEMTGPLSPGVFKPEGDTTYLHVIMPVRVQG